MWMASTNPNVKVCCMEPSPHLCPYLQRNISANGFSNISFLQAACGGSTREATLHVADREWGNSLYGNEKKAADDSHVIKTKVLTLQGVLEHFGIAVCDFLKIDCEGAEYEILLNADRDTLARVRSIALEYHLDLGSGSLPELEQLLLSNGFTVKSEATSVNRGYLYAFHAPAGHHAR
jgi:FkbM family methyltransferase